MYTNFVSIKSVINRVMVNPLMTDLPIESAILWAVDVIRLIGSSNFMERKIMRLNIEDYRCPKPEDIVFMIQARKVKSPITASKANTWAFVNGQIVNAPETFGEEYQEMYEASDPFHNFYSKSFLGDIAPSNTYKFNGNFIYTSFESGVVDIVYDGIMVDDDGLPMLPDDPSVEKAIESYIKCQYLGILQDLGKDVARAYQRAEVDYCWYVGQAQSRAAMMSIDARESLSNVMNKLMLNSREHSAFYRQSTTPERMYKQ